MSTTSQYFLELYYASNEMIRTLDSFMDSECYCSCMELVADNLKQVHFMANEIMDELVIARRELDYGNLYDIAVNDQYSLDMIVRLLEIISRNNPCDNYPITCDITSLMRNLYITACNVNMDFAYIARETEENDDYGEGVCETPPTNNENPEDNMKLDKLLKDAMYHIGEAKRITNLMFEEMEYAEGCRLKDAIYESIIENLVEARENIVEGLTLIDDGTFVCMLCDNVTGLQTAIGILNSLEYTIRLYLEYELDFCEAIDSKSMVMTQGYARLFAIVTRAIKTIICW